MGKRRDSRLAALSDLCGRERQGSRRPPRYSDEVKDLVHTLSVAGAEVTALAEAAGVSSSAIRTWLGDRSGSAAAAPAVRVLKVEDRGEGSDGRRMILMVRAADYEV